MAGVAGEESLVGEQEADVHLVAVELADQVIRLRDVHAVHAENAHHGVAEHAFTVALIAAHDDGDLGLSAWQLNLPSEPVEQIAGRVGAVAGRESLDVLDDHARVALAGGDVEAAPGVEVPRPEPVRGIEHDAARVGPPLRVLEPPMRLGDVDDLATGSPDRDRLVHEQQLEIRLAHEPQVLPVQGRVEGLRLHDPGGAADHDHGELLVHRLEDLLRIGRRDRGRRRRSRRLGGHPLAGRLDRRQPLPQDLERAQLVGQPDEIAGVVRAQQRRRPKRAVLEEALLVRLGRRPQGADQVARLLEPGCQLGRGWIAERVIRRRNSAGVESAHVILQGVA